MLISAYINLYEALTCLCMIKLSKLVYKDIIAYNVAISITSNIHNQFNVKFSKLKMNVIRHEFKSPRTSALHTCLCLKVFEGAQCKYKCIHDINPLVPTRLYLVFF